MLCLSYTNTITVIEHTASKSSSKAQRPDTQHSPEQKEYWLNFSTSDLNSRAMVLKLVLCVTKADMQISGTELNIYT